VRNVWIVRKNRVFGDTWPTQGMEKQHFPPNQDPFGCWRRSKLYVTFRRLSPNFSCWISHSQQLGTNSCWWKNIISQCRWPNPLIAGIHPCCPCLSVTSWRHLAIGFRLQIHFVGLHDFWSYINFCLAWILSNYGYFLSGYWFYDLLSTMFALVKSVFFIFLKTKLLSWYPNCFTIYQA
jgi:hypothetical protein